MSGDETAFFFQHFLEILESIHRRDVRVAVVKRSLEEVVLDVFQQLSHIIFDALNGL